MSPTSAPSAGPRITLVNGDTFVAQIKSIGPEQAVLTGGVVGELTLPTSAISAITLENKAAAPLVDTTFEMGNMDPWMPVQGVWSVQDGGLVFWGASTPSWEGAGALAALVPQKGAITVSADVQPVANQGITCELVLFADQTLPIRQSSERNGISFALSNDADVLEIYCANKGNTGNVGVAQFPRVLPGGTRSPRSRAKLTVSYDPANGSIQTWLDNQKGNEFTAAAAPKEGSYVLFVMPTPTPLAIRRLRVLPGVVPPTAEADPASDEPRVAMLDGDIVTAKGVTFADGRFLVKTDFGDMQPEMSRVAAVYLKRRGDPAKDAPASPPPAAAPGAPDASTIRVLTTDGVFTLRSCALTGDLLTGRSAIFGAVSLKRNSVRLIRFFHSPQ